MSLLGSCSRLLPGFSDAREKPDGAELGARLRFRHAIGETPEDLDRWSETVRVPDRTHPEGQPDLFPTGHRESVGPHVGYSSVLAGAPHRTVATFISIGQIIPLILLLIACGNVAILLLARAANRTGEMAIRTALGASRARVVGQLFIEALVLAVVATGFGLVVLDLVLGRLEASIELPFWLQLRVDVELVLKALALAVVSAVIAGVLPALRATGSTLQNPLQRVGSGGGSLRFGRVTGALIVLEVCLGVGALFAGGMTYRMFQPISGQDTRAAEAGRFLIANVRIPPKPAADRGGNDSHERAVRVAAMQQALSARLMGEPGVRGVAFSDVPPGEGQYERAVRMEGDGQPASYRGLPGVVSYVTPDFFQVLRVAPLAGRTLQPEDMPAGSSRPAHAVVVNHKFVERRQLQPHTVIGRSIRFTNGTDRPPGPWLVIVGVVPDIEASPGRQIFDGTPMIYMPAAPGTVNPMVLLVDLGNDPVGFAPKLRSLVAEVEPSAIISDIMALEDLPFGEMIAMRVVSSLLIAISALSILLSSAALYALMSFTVAKRTREIGIRTALGGRASSIVMTVARRALLQLALGVALGSGFWFAILALLTASQSLGPDLQRATSAWPVVLALATAIVTVIGLGACLAPTLRGLKVRPVEALRAEG